MEKTKRSLFRVNRTHSTIIENDLHENYALKIDERQRATGTGRMFMRNVINIYLRLYVKFDAQSRYIERKKTIYDG